MPVADADFHLRLPHPAFIAVVVLLFFGGTAMIFIYDDRRKLLGFLMASTAITGVTIEELRLLTVDWKVNAEATMLLTEGLEFETYQVGPFSPGRFALETAPAMASLDSILAHLKEGQKSKRVAFVMLAGGADKRQLRGRLLATYGSNEGLAAARAHWVRQQIDSLLPSQRILHWAKGATQFGDSITDDQFTKDRHVLVVVALKPQRLKRLSPGTVLTLPVFPSNDPSSPLLDDRPSWSDDVERQRPRATLAIARGLFASPRLRSEGRLGRGVEGAQAAHLRQEEDVLARPGNEGRALAA